MRLLFLNTNIGYGGASKIMVWVANICANEGYDVYFLTYRDSEYKQILDQRIKANHIQLEDKSGKGKGLWNTVRCIRSYIITKKIDVAVGFLSPSQLRLSLACIGLSCKLLFSQRGDPFQVPYGLKNKIIQYVNHRLFCKADAFVFQTPMAANYYPKSVRNKSVIICNPIHPLVRSVQREGNITKDIVCVARLDIVQKRQDILIKAFNLISSKYPEYRLKLYGDGFSLSDENTLRKLANGNSKIDFMGQTRDVAGAIQNAAVAVLSSDFEGIPNALLEYMSIGVPCISTNCSPGGAAMLIKNKVNGLLVRKGNVIELADAIEYMITHPEEAEQMGRNSMKVNELYSETVIAQKWLELFKSLNK